MNELSRCWSCADQPSPDNRSRIYPLPAATCAQVSSRHRPAWRSPGIRYSQRLPAAAFRESFRPAGAWSNNIMSCWIIPSHFGSDTAQPRRATQSLATVFAVPRKPVPRSTPYSSLFQSTNRIDRSVLTSGLLKTRASSITSAVPEPSSLAASPYPCPSMWAATMYMSSGWTAPILVQ